MKVWGVYDDEIRELVEEVGLAIYNDNYSRGIRRRGLAYIFRLGLRERREDGAYRFQRISRRGRRNQYVCWHGHREFFFALYRRFPDARVKTGVMEYRNRQHFKETYRETMGLTCNGWEGVHPAGECVCMNTPPSRVESETPLMFGTHPSASNTISWSPVEMSAITGAISSVGTTLSWSQAQTEALREALENLQNERLD